MNKKQHTLNATIELQGVGLHTGEKCKSNHRTSS